MRKREQQGARNRQRCNQRNGQVAEKYNQNSGDQRQPDQHDVPHGRRGQIDQVGAVVQSAPVSSREAAIRRSTRSLFL